VFPELVVLDMHMHVVIDRICIQGDRIKSATYRSISKYYYNCLCDNFCNKNECKRSTWILYIYIKYSMHDVIFDVVSNCVWSCDIG